MKYRTPNWLVATALALSAVGVFLLINITNPLEASSLGILTVFVLLYLMTVASLVLISRLILAITHALRPPGNTPVQVDRLEKRSKRIDWIAVALGFVPVFILSLNSIGQLNFTDIVLIVVIEVIAVFYIIKKV
jgi:hypothetical protein